MHCKSPTLIYYQYKNGMYVQWQDLQLKQHLEKCEFSVLHIDESIRVFDDDSSLLECIPNKFNPWIFSKYHYQKLRFHNDVCNISQLPVFIWTSVLEYQKALENNNATWED